MSAKRVPPGSDQIARAVQERLELAERIHDPGTLAEIYGPGTLAKNAIQVFIPFHEVAVRAIREEFSTTATRAREWIFAALEDGAIAMVSADTNGRTLTRWVKRDPDRFPGPSSRFMLDTLVTGEDGGYGPALDGYLDHWGIIHLVDRLPEGVKAASDDSIWVTVPSVLDEAIKKMISFANHKHLMHQAAKNASDALVDNAHHEALALIRALLEGVGDPDLDGDDVLDLRWFTPGNKNRPPHAIAEITLRGEQIERFAARLRRMGVTPDTVWGAE